MDWSKRRLSEGDQSGGSLGCSLDIDEPADLFRRVVPAFRPAQQDEQWEASFAPISTFSTASLSALWLPGLELLLLLTSCVQHDVQCSRLRKVHNLRRACHRRRMKTTAPFFSPLQQMLKLLLPLPAPFRSFLFRSVVEYRLRLRLSPSFSPGVVFWICSGVFEKCFTRLRGRIVEGQGEKEARELELL